MQQLFGSIETLEGTARAMLCIDGDRSGDYMIHWFGSGITPGAILSSATEKNGSLVRLKPSMLFRQAQGGNLFALSYDQLTQDERKGLEQATAELKRDGTKLVGTWTSIDGRARAMAFDGPSEKNVAAYTCTGWNDFKDWVKQVRASHDAIYFRGHGSNRFRLRTTLSRAGRVRIDRYCASELIEFKSHAEAVLGMRIDMSKGDDYSLLLGLAQHHGLPTPLLDWTASPYIAAFFGVADALESRSQRPDDTHVRVFALTREFVRATSPPVVTLPAVNPYIACLAVAPIHNPRLYAQQGKFLVTNVSDVETFIRSIEEQLGVTHLLAADVPISSASDAMEDLQFMGVTAANMFPGLDGVSRMIRHAMSTSGAPAPAAGKPSAVKENPERAETTASQPEAGQLFKALSRLFPPKPS